MPAVDVLDDTFVRVDPAVVRAATESLWAGWLPDLTVVVREDRGVKGVRWVVGSVAASAGLSGTAEVWLEPLTSGTVVHLYVRLDPAPGPGVAPGRRARDLPDRIRRSWKRGLHRSKDVLEGETQA